MNMSEFNQKPIIYFPNNVCQISNLDMIHDTPEFDALKPYGLIFCMTVLLF